MAKRSSRWSARRARIRAFMRAIGVGGERQHRRRRGRHRHGSPHPSLCPGTALPRSPGAARHGVRNLHVDLSALRIEDRRRRRHRSRTSTPPGYARAAVPRAFNAPVTPVSGPRPMPKIATISPGATAPSRRLMRIDHRDLAGAWITGGGASGFRHQAAYAIVAGVGEVEVAGAIQEEPLRAVQQRRRRPDRRRPRSPRRRCPRCCGSRRPASPGECGDCRYRR